MKGTRMKDGEAPRHEWPHGAYGRVRVYGEWKWGCVTPNGHHGSLAGHKVEEHDDATITVSPSIRVTAGLDMSEVWHGFLERGVWRDA